MGKASDQQVQAARGAWVAVYRNARAQVRSDPRRGVPGEAELVHRAWNAEVPLGPVQQFRVRRQAQREVTGTRSRRGRK